jgi:hypothetical protein
LSAVHRVVKRRAAMARVARRVDASTSRKSLPVTRALG